VVCASKHGGGARVLAGDLRVPRLLRRAGELLVYAAGSPADSALWAVPLAGGEPWVLLTGHARDLALFGDEMFFTCDRRGMVYRAHLHHGDPVAIAVDQPGAWAIAVDASGIYWGNAGLLGSEATTSDLVVCRHGDGTPRVLVSPKA
jgi:hypothetical protein